MSKKKKTKKSVRELLDQFQKKELTLDQTETKILESVKNKIRNEILEELADQELTDLVRDMKKECASLGDPPVD